MKPFYPIFFFWLALIVPNIINAFHYQDEITRINAIQSSVLNAVILVMFCFLSVGLIEFLKKIQSGETIRLKWDIDIKRIGKTLKAVPHRGQ